MFSKAKRFEPTAVPKNVPKDQKIPESVKKSCTKIVPPPPPAIKPKATSLTTPSKSVNIPRSQCGSVRSVKSFATPKPFNGKTSNNPKKPTTFTKVTLKTNEKVTDDILKEHEVEIRNKDYTILEYSQQIDDLKNEISQLQKKLKTTEDSKNLTEKISDLTLTEMKPSISSKDIEKAAETEKCLKLHIEKLEKQCEALEQEIYTKQIDLSSLEELITIRDSLCKDLQDKLTNSEKNLEETQQRLEMVKGHHALALEANESIRREYKAELETIKVKFEEEKQTITSKSKIDQENIKTKYISMRNQLLKEKDEIVRDLEQQIITKENEMKAKLEQIEEATHEKLRLCEIQFEERTQTIQNHIAQQQEKIMYLENERQELQHHLNLTEEQNKLLQKEFNFIKKDNDSLKCEKIRLLKEIDDLKEESKKKYINFENDINKLTFEVDKAVKEKNKYEMSLSVTRDIVQVLTLRLRESDDELETMEADMQKLNHINKTLDEELSTCKNTLNNCMMECNEYKDALVNILKSKAALANEHTRIMEHNVSLIESLQNVEKEAYRELGSIKNELLEDVEFIKKESNSQILMLRDEVDKKQMLCELATEHAGIATAAAEQSRVLLAHAAAEIARLEQDNNRLHKQIQDEQSLVVEVSLLRQENEELTMTVAKQSSIIEKMKKDMENMQISPKSPSVLRKSHKIGKENLLVISPLRERNQNH